MVKLVLLNGSLHIRKETDKNSSFVKMTKRNLVEALGKHCPNDAHFLTKKELISRCRFDEQELSQVL